MDNKSRLEIDLTITRLLCGPTATLSLRYSSDIATAWKLVEDARDKGITLTLKNGWGTPI